MHVCDGMLRTSLSCSVHKRSVVIETHCCVPTVYTRKILFASKNVSSKKRKLNKDKLSLRGMYNDRSVYRIASEIVSCSNFMKY